MEEGKRTERKKEGEGEGGKKEEAKKVRGVFLKYLPSLLSLGKLSS